MTVVFILVLAFFYWYICCKCVYVWITKRKKKSQITNLNIQWRNWGGALGPIASPLRKNWPFLKKYFCFCFASFWLLKIETLLRVHSVKNACRSCGNNHNRPFKDSNFSSAIKIAWVWFRCVQIQVFLHLRKVDSRNFWKFDPYTQCPIFSFLQHWLQTNPKLYI